MKPARISLLALVILGGCTTYYRITDPTSGKQYYTTSVKQDNGGTKFHDAQSNSDVTIQNSEIIKISEDQYKAVVKSSN